MIYKSYKTIDSVGRIVIPKDFRKELDWQDNDDILVEIENGKVQLSKAMPSCVFCGKTSGLKSFKGKTVCESCIKELNTP